MRDTCAHGHTKAQRQTHQNRGDVLRLHDKELVISDNGLKELERYRCVLIAADIAGNQLRVQR